MTNNPFVQLLIAVGLGLLVGLQRERQGSDVAGIRTFPLITLFGAVSALLAQHWGPWVLAASIIGLSAMVVMGNLSNLRRGEIDPGITTEVAILVMFCAGAAVVKEHTAIAVVVGGGVAVLLSLKTPMHRFAERIGESEFRAIIRLTVIALVVLPILPNRTYGPYDVLNPFEIWLMVVLIVGISLAAYMLQRWMGPQSGTIASGILGGLISSTAATFGFARETRLDGDTTPMAAAIIVIAAGVVFGRVLLEILVVAPGIFASTAPPLVMMMVMIWALALIAYVTSRGTYTAPLSREAPADLRAALVFGLLYAVVIFLVAAAKEHFGTSGMYMVAGLSGLTDMDALTLSTAQLAKDGRIDPERAWRLILVASMANLVFKGAAVAVVGHPRLLARVGIFFGIAVAGGVGILVFWIG